MRKPLTLLLLLLLGIQVFAQEQRLQGRLVDAVTGNPVSGALVTGNDQVATTDKDGNFVLVFPGPGSIDLTITAETYPVKRMNVMLPQSTALLISMRSGSVPVETAGLSDVTISSLDMENDQQGQYISGLLHATGDIFISTAGYTLGAAYFRIRGYDAENTAVYMNGILVNDPENGRPTWSEWGGLNDATRNKEVVNGLSQAGFSYGDLGGTTNIITRASQFSKQQKFSYSLTNRAYRQRLMYTASTGLMKNNWAFAVSLSRRWAEEGYVEGTFYDNWAYFLAAEKKFSTAHSLAITLYASPTRRGMQGGATQEAYDLTDNSYYNPNWGYQDGEKRNARVRNAHEPMIILNDYLNFGQHTRLTQSLGVSFGKFGTTALNWYNARDPRPDYYRYLPSYETDPLVVEAMTEAWQNDPAHSQIDWNRLYQVNYLANQQGKQANYVLEERRLDHTRFTYSAILNSQINKNTAFTGGLNLSRYNGHHYKKLFDLLGGNYWVDIDQFSQRDFSMDTVTIQNDLNNPDRIVKEGDIYGYDYDIHVNTGDIWAQTEFTFNRIDFFAAARLSSTTFWRDGKMRNGRAPENSYGESEKKHFLDPSVKAGATLKITGHHFLQANLGYQRKAPLVRNAFLSQYIKNTYARGLESETHLSGDLSYIYRSDRMNLRLTGYHTVFQNQTELMSYYHDDYLTYVNMSLTGIDKVHQGLELGTEWKATKALSLSLVAALGNFVFTSRPEAVISTENGTRADTTELIYQKYFFVNGTPQQAGSFGIRYAAPHYWYFNANLNYFDKIYLDFNPLRRSSAALANLGPGDPMIGVITKQEKLSNGFTLDASIGKSIRMKGGYFININFSVNNILDNQELKTGGYEQLRFDFTEKNINKFPPKYFYAYGRSFFLNFNIRI